MLEPSANFVDVEVISGREYTFQAVAREEKGIIKNIWNKSPTVNFQTTDDIPETTAPGEVSDYMEAAVEQEDDEPGTMSCLYHCIF
jgi:hypothetical protein